MIFQRSVVVAINMLFIGSVAGHSEELSLGSAKNLPVTIRDGIEIASRRDGGKPASLNIICSLSGDKHFVLITRLPFPRWLEGRIIVRKPVSTSVFANGIEQQFKIDFEISNVGGTAETLGNFLGITEGGEPDTAFSARLKPQHVDALETWFGTTLPEQVSVVGLLETGVYMRGLVTGNVIREFSASCAPTP